MRIIHARELVRPAQAGYRICDKNSNPTNKYRSSRQETRTVQIALSGRWVEKYFSPGQEVYVYESGGDLLLSSSPPQPIAMSSLEELKMKFTEPGIPTTR